MLKQEYFEHLNSSYYDKNAKNQILHPGDKVLVANKTPRGKCKLKDKWESVPHVVVRQLGELPVYTVRPIGSTHTRNLHRNLLVICPFEVEDETVGHIPSSQPEHAEISYLSDFDQTESELSDDSTSSHISSRRVTYQRPRRIIKPPSRLGDWQ